MARSWRVAELLNLHSKYTLNCIIPSFIHFFEFWMSFYEGLSHSSFIWGAWDYTQLYIVCWKYDTTPLLFDYWGVVAREQVAIIQVMISGVRDGRYWLNPKDWALQITITLWLYQFLQFHETLYDYCLHMKA